MALIKCPNCKREISDTTKKCIHYKTKIKIDNNNLKINYRLFIPISIIILFFIVSFIAYKIDNNKIHYNDKKQDTGKVQTNDENNLNKNQESTNSTDNIDNNYNLNSEKEENNTTNNNSSSNNNSNSNNNNISSNNNASNNNNNNSNTSSKITIDATENKNCPSGYTYQNGSIYADAPCKKTDIIYGTLTYSCSGSMVLVGDKCEMTYTSTPYNGKCYGTGYVLNGDICEKKEQFDAMISGLQCPAGYSKYVSDKKDIRCYKTEYVKQNITYSCPSGYTLNGNKCEK